MAGMVAIPREALGTALLDWTIINALRKLNPEIHADMGACLNIYHPYMEQKQGIFWRGQHLGTLDRGTIPQAPIWSTKTEPVRVPASDMSYAELNDQWTAAEVEHRVDGTERKTGFYWVKRQVHDRMLWCGWQWSIRKIYGRCLKLNVPGITKAALEKELGVTLDFERQDIKEMAVAENRTHLYDGGGRRVEI